MELYILRHAIAVPRGTPGFPNDDRPLTTEGIAKMERAARGIALLVPNVDVILTSPLRRAHETATIAAKALASPSPVSVCTELEPGTDHQKLFALLEQMLDRRRVMIVGHEPDLSFIASRLLGASSSSIEFRKGCLCRIDLSGLPPQSLGVLLWHLAPRQLRMLAKK